MPDINIGQISEALNDKMDRDGYNVQSPADVIVAKQDPTSSNSYTWYRKYASGWVEQGGVKSATSVADGSGTAGNTQINLPITMANSNYWYSANAQVGGSGWDYGNGVILNTRTTTKLTLKVISGTSDSMQIFWQVKGYAAS